MTGRRETEKDCYALMLETISNDRTEAEKRFQEVFGRQWELDVDGDLVTLRFGSDLSSWMARTNQAEKDLKDLTGWVKEQTEESPSDWLELRQRLGLET